MLTISKRKKWTLGILLVVMLAWGFYGIHIKQKAVQESRLPEVAQGVEKHLRKVDSNALTDKGKIKNYKILYSQSEYDFIKGLCVYVIVNNDANLRVTFYKTEKSNIIGNDLSRRNLDIKVRESEAFIEEFRDGN